MLSLLINAAIGFVAAGTLTSLAQSARAFVPTWQRLQNDLAACDNPRVLRVTIHERPVEAGKTQPVTTHRITALAYRPQPVAPRAAA